MWETKISLRELSKREVMKVQEKCMDINKRDKTFLFGILENTLTVRSETKEKAMKRGAWLTNKMDELKGLNWNVGVKIEVADKDK